MDTSATRKTEETSVGSLYIHQLTQIWWLSPYLLWWLSPYLLPASPQKAGEVVRKIGEQWARARVDIHLVVDGEVIDLNRIPLPADTPIIDKRWPSDTEKSQAGK
jgi:hypothetical protein